MNNRPVLAILVLAGSLSFLSPGLLSPSSVSAAEFPASAELPDGTYLFGDVPKTDQMGSGYVVFTQKDGRVVGALYHANADYNCFSGVQENQQLYITAYSLGDEPWRAQVSLPRMHIIPKLNEVSLKTLTACRNEMAKMESTSTVTARQFTPPDVVLPAAPAKP
jgi:hypothetical protein